MSKPTAYRKPSFQETIGQGLAQNTIGVACQTLLALCNRGALDVLERDDEGLNVVDRFCQQAPLNDKMLETIELLGAREAWAKPFKGRFVAMDMQLDWLRNGALGALRQNLEHRASTKDINEYMARMISQVDGEWLGLGRDGGAAVVAKVLDCGRDVIECLDACWDRGGDVHARLEDGTLAIAGIDSPEILQAWIARGGDVNTPVKLPDGMAAWKHIAWNAQQATGMDETHDIHKFLTGHVDEHDLQQELLFLKAWHERANQGAMFRHLLAITDWHQAKRPDGTPVWMAAIEARPDLVNNFLARKRARPDFTERDGQGRTAWYAIMGMGSLGHIHQLEKELPLCDYGRDTRGRGLLAQVIEDGGGLRALAECDNALQQRLAITLAILDGTTGQDRAAILDGMDTLGLDRFSELGEAAKQVVGPKLFCKMALLQDLDPAVAVDIGRWALHVDVVNEQGDWLSAADIAEIARNAKWVVQTHGAGFPDVMADWLERITPWETTAAFDVRREAVKEIKPMIAAIVSQAQLQTQVPRPGETARKGPRF